MRIRTIKPEFWAHPILSRADDSVRLAAIGLLNVADDEGYFLASAPAIRSALWPFDEDSTKARRVLATLTSGGYVETCEHPSHGAIGRVVNFTKHQRIDRPTPSKIKAYWLDECSSKARRVLDESSLLEQGTGIKGKEKAPSGQRELPLAMPEILSTSEEFCKVWERWLAHLKQKRKPATQHAQDLQLKRMAEIGIARAIAAINHSIENNWQGIYEPSATGKNSRQQGNPRLDGVCRGGGTNYAEAAKRKSQLAEQVAGAASVTSP